MNNQHFDKNLLIKRKILHFLARVLIFLIFTTLCVTLYENIQEYNGKI